LLDEEAIPPDRSPILIFPIDWLAAPPAFYLADEQHGRGEDDGTEEGGEVEEAEEGENRLEDVELDECDGADTGFLGGNSVDMGGGGGVDLWRWEEREEVLELGVVFSGLTEVDETCNTEPSNEEEAETPTTLVGRVRLMPAV
jgi:hypothetical protein